MKTRKLTKTTIAAAVSLALSGTVNAATVTIDLMDSNRPSLMPEKEYLQLVIRDGADGSVNFGIKSNVAGEDFDLYGLRKFALNFGDFDVAKSNLRTPKHWRFGQMSDAPFGDFDLVLRNKAKRAVNGLKFSIVDVEGDSAAGYAAAISDGMGKHGNYAFAAKISPIGLDTILPMSRGKADFSEARCEELNFRPRWCRAEEWEGLKGIRNAMVAGGNPQPGNAVVPIPGALGLMGSASAVLGLLARRRRKLQEQI